MKNWLRNNGLSIAMFGAFAVFLVGQTVTGYSEYNAGQTEHGSKEVGFVTYLSTGHFSEAVFENWESEFLQMGAYIILTISLRQKGSSESKKMDEQEEVDRDPRQSRGAKDVPGPVKRGGWQLRIYENSLGLAFVGLFLLSIGMHAIGGSRSYSTDQIEHGGSPVSAIEYIATSRFWFESFQNWQSEFLSVGAMIYLSIFLRQRGSPESKPVDATHSFTGSQ